MPPNQPNKRSFGQTLKEQLFGREGQFKQEQRFNPEQQQAFSQILQQALSGLQPGAFGQGFEPIAQQARETFQQQTVPSLAERFSSLGAQRSSGFQQALGQAGAGLESQLAGQKAQFGLQQQGLLQQLLGQGLTPQFESVFEPGGTGLFGSLFGGLGQGAGQAIATSFAGRGGQGTNVAGGGQGGSGPDIASIVKLLSLFGV